jgi:hypothetical protein
MPKILISCAFLLLCFALAAQSNPLPPQIILQLKGARMADPALAAKGKTGNLQVDQINQTHGATRVHALRAGKRDPKCWYTITFPENINLETILTAYRQIEAVELAEQDHIGATQGIPGIGTPATIPPAPVLLSPNDPLYSRQWGLNNNGSFTLSAAISGADIDMEKAWNITKGDSSIVVCIMDSGIKRDHPEFEGRLWVNQAEIPGNGIDDDQNNYIDDVSGWDFANNDNDPTDDHGHGTNVTGIIGANGNNGIGYAGVDWNCKLMSLKGINKDNFGYYSWWAEAIMYAVDNGARVINLSVGGNSYSPILGSAITYALNNNVICVVCMMNGNTSSVFYPAGFPGVIAVGATNPNDFRTRPFFWANNSGSNYGNHITVVAPGNYIYGLNYLSNTNFDTYWGGTSQATPHVTGLIALLLAQNPDRTPDQIKTILTTTAEDKVGKPTEDIPGWDEYHGFGRINAFKALSVGVSSTTTPILNSTLRITPNPANGSFQVTRQTALSGMCSLYDGQGKLVFQTKLDQQTTFDLQTNLPNGLYWMRIKTAETLEMGRVMIQR